MSDDCPICALPATKRAEIEYEMCFNANLDANDLAAKYGITSTALSPGQLAPGGAHRGNLATAGEHLRRHRSPFVPKRPTP